MSIQGNQTSSTNYSTHIHTNIVQYQIDTAHLTSNPSHFTPQGNSRSTVQNLEETAFHSHRSAEIITKNLPIQITALHIWVPDDLSIVTGEDGSNQLLNFGSTSSGVSSNLKKFFPIANSRADAGSILIHSKIQTVFHLKFYTSFFKVRK